MTKDDDLREFQRNVERAQDARWAELRRRHSIHEQFEGRRNPAREFLEGRMLGTLAQYLLRTESVGTVTVIMEALMKSDPAMPGTEFSANAAVSVVELAMAEMYGRWPFDGKDDEEYNDEDEEA
jgi:hypothetical protein